MSKTNSTTVQVRPGFTESLTIVFIFLKVFGFVNWSWWWVFSPLWISLGLVVLFLIVVLLILFVAAVAAMIAGK